MVQVCTFLRKHLLAVTLDCELEFHLARGPADTGSHHWHPKNKQRSVQLNFEFESTLLSPGDIKTWGLW